MPFDVFIAYVSWGADGKRRPMLLYRIGENDAKAFPITTQYADKSETIRARYFAIADWEQSGLHRPSYIDTGTPYIFSMRALETQKPIGTLTENDKLRLLAFLRD